MLSVLCLVVLFASCHGFRLSCHCQEETCPGSCSVQLPDPCGCCPFVCPAVEGEPCTNSHDCEHQLVCKDSSNGRVCVCNEDDRMVCGTNGVSYASVCLFKKEQDTANTTFDHWGPCHFKPEIVSKPEDRTLRVGQPLALDCEAKGFPIPTITWMFTGRDGITRQLPSDDELVAVQLRGGPEHLMVTSWVQLVEARVSDSGFYSCEATNNLGSARAEATVLHQGN